MKILAAGIGNIFFGDDGFGVEVANRMLAKTWPPGVEVAEYGIRGVHLAYQLLDGYDTLVLIDAVPLGDEPPGTIAVIEPDMDAVAAGVADAGDDAAPTMDAHSMNPAVVLGMLTSMGGRIDRVLVVGCQPGVIEDGIGLSAAVAAAVDPTIDVVSEVLADLLRHDPSIRQESTT